MARAPMALPVLRPHRLPGLVRAPRHHPGHFVQTRRPHDRVARRRIDGRPRDRRQNAHLLGVVARRDEQQEDQPRRSPVVSPEVDPPGARPSASSGRVSPSSAACGIATSSPTPVLSSSSRSKHRVPRAPLPPCEQRPECSHQLGDRLGRRLGVQLADEGAPPQQRHDVFLGRGPAPRTHDGDGPEAGEQRRGGNRGERAPCGSIGGVDPEDAPPVAGRGAVIRMASLCWDCSPPRSSSS